MCIQALLTYSPAAAGQSVSMRHQQPAHIPPTPSTLSTTFNPLMAGHSAGSWRQEAAHESALGTVSRGTALTVSSFPSLFRKPPLVEACGLEGPRMTQRFAEQHVGGLVMSRRMNESTSQHRIHRVSMYQAGRMSQRLEISLETAAERTRSPGMAQHSLGRPATSTNIWPIMPKRGTDASYRLCKHCT